MKESLTQRIQVLWTSTLGNRLIPLSQETSHLHLQTLRIPLRSSQPLQTNNPATQAGKPVELNPQNKTVKTADFI